MKFQKVARLRSQTRAVSAKHAERNEVKRSMISGNFEIFLNNQPYVNLYIYSECCAATRSMATGNFEIFLNNPP